jgi:hypothetical protein
MAQGWFRLVRGNRELAERRTRKRGAQGKIGELAQQRCAPFVKIVISDSCRSWHWLFLPDFLRFSTLEFSF